MSIHVVFLRCAYFLFIYKASIKLERESLSVVSTINPLRASMLSLFLGSKEKKQWIPHYSSTTNGTPQYWSVS